MEQALELARALTLKTDLSLKLSTDRTDARKTNQHANNNVLVHPNSEPFNCPTCLQRFEIGAGIILVDCLHEFCRKCIIAKIHQSIEFIRVNCPFDNHYKCESFLSEREVKGLVTEDVYNRFIQNNQLAAKAIMEVIEISDSDESFRSLDSDPEDQIMKSEVLNHCPRCLRMFSKENGIIVKSCNHSLCKECIIDNFFKNQKYQMKCEFKTNEETVCGNAISQNEICSVLNEVGLNGLNETIVKD